MSQYQNPEISEVVSELNQHYDLGSPRLEDSFPATFHLDLLSCRWLLLSKLLAYVRIFGNDVIS